MKKATINEQDHTVTIDGRVFKIGEEVTPKPTPEERLLQLLEGVVRKHDFDKFPNTASFWLKEGKVVAQEMKSGISRWTVRKYGKFLKESMAWNTRR